MLKVRTLSPVRSPISADSERRAADALSPNGDPEERSAALSGIFDGSAVLEPFEWPWANGYGTLQHDNLPAFFQPFACYQIANDKLVYPDSLHRLLVDYVGSVEQCCLYLYDDTVALLQLDLVFEETGNRLGELLATHALDHALSEFAIVVYSRIIYPEFRNYAANFGKRRGGGAQLSVDYLRDPGKLSVFRDVSFTSEGPPESYVLWTGRYILTPPQTLSGPLGDCLGKWVSSPGLKDEPIESRQIVGSGNILVLADDAEQEAEDWFRGLSICQFYNAILSIYGGILKSSYSELNEYTGARRRKGRELQTLMADITRTLDHLEFTRLEFNDAVTGVQAGRANVVRSTYDAWNIGEMIDSAVERTNLIRSKISRLLEARSTELNRSVELILSGIGGVAVIDLFISLTTASRSLGQDDIPGLLDVFEWLQPDGSIALSTTILVLISAYIYQAKR